MSIIGPRPLLVSYLPWYTEEEKQRHDVRPGLSGLAQVNGRNSVTWEEKFSWDLKYVDRMCCIFSRSLMSLLLIRFFSPVDVLGFGISIFLSENGALENVSFSALFIDFTREKICAGL